MSWRSITGALQKSWKPRSGFSPGTACACRSGHGRTRPENCPATDCASSVRARRRPRRKLPREVITKARGAKTLGGLGGARRGLPGWQADAITDAMEDIELVRDAVREGMPALVRALRSAIGLGDAMKELDSSREAA